MTLSTAPRRRMLGLVLVASALVLLGGCTDRGVIGLTVVSDGVHRFDGLQPNAMIIVEGSVTLPAGTRVSDSVWVLGGNLAVAGRIEQDLSILGGTLRFEAGAEVGGNLNLAGGSVNGLELAEVGGAITDQPGIEVPLGPAWQSGQPPLTQLALAILQILVVAGFALVIGLIFPRPLGRVKGALETQPLACLALGLLGGLVALPLIVFMAFTIVLIPVALAALVLLGIGLAYGWAAVGSATMMRLSARARGRPLALVAAAGAGGLSLAAQLITFVPLVGAMITIGVMATGFGAVILTRLGTRSG
jgi:hypothetical protein